MLHTRLWLPAEQENCLLPEEETYSDVTDPFTVELKCHKRSVISLFLIVKFTCPHKTCRWVESVDSNWTGSQNVSKIYLLQTNYWAILGNSLIYLILCSFNLSGFFFRIITIKWKVSCTFWCGKKQKKYIFKSSPFYRICQTNKSFQVNKINAHIIFWFVLCRGFGTKPQQQASTWTDTWIWFKASRGNHSQSCTQTAEQITTYTAVYSEVWTAKCWQHAD